MTAVDKAAIAWTIVIVAVGVAIAGMGDQLQSSPSPQKIAQDLSLEKSNESMKKMEESMEKQKEMIDSKVTPEPKMVEKEKPMEKAAIEKPAGPKTVKVSLPSGTAVPGCEETNKCFVPASVSIKVGDTVAWSNNDSAAHTVTSGSPTSGPSGVFDSSLLIAGGIFEHTFDSSGTIDYFCMVHPWMVGNIKVS